MSTYEIPISVPVTGQQSVDGLAGSFDKLGGRAAYVDEKIREMVGSNGLLYKSNQLQSQILETLRAQLSLMVSAGEKYSASTKGAAAATNELSAAQTRVVGSTMAASSALRVMEGAMPLRAAASFLGSLQGIGAALQVAFPVVGAIALAEVLTKIPDELHKGILAIEGWSNKSAEAFKQSTEKADEYLSHMIAMDAKLRGLNLIGVRGAARDALESGNLRAELADVDAALAKQHEQLKKDRATIDYRPGLPNPAGSYLSGAIAHAFGVAQPDVHAPSAIEVEQAKLRYSETLKSIKELGDRREMLAKISIPTAEREQGAAAAAEANTEAKALDAARRSFLERNANDPVAKAIISARMQVMEHPTLAGDFALLGTDSINDAALQEWRKNANGVIKGIQAEPGQASRVFRQQLEQQIRDDEHAAAGMQRAVSTWDAAERGRVDTQVSTIRDNATRRGRLIAASAGPGDELSTLRQQISLRKEAADLELKVKEAHSDIFDIDKERLAYAKEIGDLELDYATKVLEIKKKQKEEFESEAVAFVSAAHGGSRGLQSFGMGLANKLEGAAVSRLAGAAWGDPSKGTGISSQLAKIFPSGGPLDKIFGLGVKGADPLKTATDANTVATNANTEALRNLRAAATSPSGGGGSAGGGYGMSRIGSGSIPGFGGYTETDTGGSSLPTDGQSGDYGGEYGDAQAVSAMASRMPKNTGLGKDVAIAGAAAGAALGAYAGFKEGGARGALAGTGSILGGAGAIASMIPGGQLVGGILAGVGMGLGMINTLMGDPVANRYTHIAHTLRDNQYMAPVAVNASMSTGGTYSDMDRFGNVRTSNFSPFPTVQQGFFDYRNNVTVPGRTLSNFGGPAGAAAPTIVMNVNAMDSKSIVDNHAAIADAVAKSMQLGSSPTLSETLSSRNA